MSPLSFITEKIAFYAHKSSFFEIFFARRCTLPEMPYLPARLELNFPFDILYVYGTMVLGDSRRRGLPGSGRRHLG